MRRVRYKERRPNRLRSFLWFRPSCCRGVPKQARPPFSIVQDALNNPVILRLPDKGSRRTSITVFATTDAGTAIPGPPLVGERA